MKRGVRYKHMQTLNIDKEFSSLIAPLSEMEFRFLEASIRKDGCIEPIVTWRGTIIDGHNRYHICCKWNLPFTTMEKQFSDRVEAIAWICAKQLGRRNISEEIRKYLIGRQFDAEKIIRRRRIDNGETYGIHLSTETSAEQTITYDSTPAVKNDSIALHTGTRKNPTADLIGDEHHISHSTVEKYSLYSRALDVIGQSAPSLQERILSGKCKLSYTNVISLSRMEPAAVEELAKHLNIQEASASFIPYHFTREVVENLKAENSRPLDIHPEIKRMPKPDPDADVNRLTLTITAWISSIKKTQSQLTIGLVSTDARKRLEDALNGLSACIRSIFQLIERGEPDAE